MGAIDLVNSYRREQERRESKGLTSQDIEIIKLICYEKTSREIAKKLGKSVRTIEGSRLAIMKIIGAKSTAGVIMYALREGIVTVYE